MRYALSCLLVAAVSLTGCGFLPDADTGIDCGWMETTEPARDAGHTAILLDRSASAVGPDYVTALDGVVRDAVEAHDVVDVGIFDGSASTVRWTARARVTDRGRANAGNRDADDETARRCLHDELVRAAGEPATTAGTDVMGAVAMGGAELRAARGARRLVVATDGLSTTGCADLTGVTVGDLTMIERIAALCRARATGPDLSGVAVTLLGVGHPGAGQPLPSTLQLDWLASLWAELCAGLGASSCDVSTAPVDITDQNPAGGPPDPAVPFPPAEKGVRQSDGSTRYRLDSSVLFRPNDWTLSAAGKAELTGIAADIRAAGAGRVTVDGYTEARASESANRTLARHRANAVRMFLLGQGVPHVTATGHAGTAPGCRPAPHDERARQCNRRVDIVAGGGTS